MLWRGRQPPSGGHLTVLAAQRGRGTGRALALETVLFFFFEGTAYKDERRRDQPAQPSPPHRRNDKAHGNTSTHQPGEGQTSRKTSKQDRRQKRRQPKRQRKDQDQGKHLEKATADSQQMETSKADQTRSRTQGRPAADRQGKPRTKTSSRGREAAKPQSGVSSGHQKA